MSLARNAGRTLTGVLAIPAIAGLLALPAPAQNAPDTAPAAPSAPPVPAKPTLLDYISPDRIAARLVQMGIMALRSQADIVYGTIATSALTGSVTVTDLKVWPILDWAEDGTCEIAFDRLRLSTVPLDDLDHIRLKLQLSGGSMGEDCLPPDARAALPQVAAGGIVLSRATLDLDYTISTAAALVHAQVITDGMAAIGLTFDFNYVWFDASKDFDDPVPVVFLNSGRLTVENLGLWDRVKGMLPPMVTDAAQAGAMIDEAIRQMDPMAETPSPQRQELADSAKVAWSEFLANPRRLVLETGFDDGPRFLDLVSWDRSGPDKMLDDLMPRVVTVAASARAMIPADLIARAYDPAGTLSDEELLRVGTALATGEGAPRDIARARELLGQAAGKGSAPAALVLAQALETRDAEAAYLQALTAAEAGVPGAAGLLDRIEGALPFARVLELQHEKVEGVEHPVEALEHLTSVRNEAGKRMTGRGQTRSYEIAALWAMIGAAAGDAECADILAEIDQKVRLGGPEAQAVWEGQEAASSELARSAWTGFDLPATFGGQ